MIKPSTIFALAILAFQSAPAVAGPGGAIYGIWRNPRGTIDVRIAPCGAEICGTIARASPQAQKDAHNAGVETLLGVQLLRHYTQVSDNRWEGRVYVPDMGGTFSSHIVAQSPDTLKISGCLIGGWVCKSQLWTRH